ncbi:MAG: hypothetical protein HFF90_04635 [Oscillibacter sp.]|nr:hypothetical protein [Oscillibacter sp.]
MTDFMKWFYAHYIQPGLAEIPKEDYASYFSFLENNLDKNGWEAYEKVLEFTAAHAFALGVRVGQGFARDFSA